jgi:hypothetical protein
VNPVQVIEAARLIETVPPTLSGKSTANFWQDLC